MPSSKPTSLDDRVLIVAPIGNDALNAAEVFRHENIAHATCADIERMCELAREGAGALLITQESLSRLALECLAKLLREQAPWSDIPIILLTSGGEPSIITSLRRMTQTSTITVLERPLRVMTLVSAVRAALRSRLRQYQIRDLLFQREHMMRELQDRAKILETSQKELLLAQVKISSHARELEQTVEERTAKLRETVAQLEAFSYSISHDMRGPLRAMQQYAQILIEDHGSELQGDAADYLQRISRGANRMDRLIQDVLTYSRAARNAIPMAPVNVDNLLKDIVQQYPTLQPPKAEIEICTPLPAVLGNEASLTQVISNLLGNAVKFVPKGRKPKVRIYPGKQNGKVELIFEDNGIGIAPENQNRIFDIFERINASEDYEGTGIGLAIVKKTVERMGGEVGLESKLGAGSRFWVRLLPAQKADANVAEARPHSLPS